ncbi:MAG TPA: SDR family NAD(P)-dependent oxidoreductase [Novosphingobium sp.]|nr:SDR family NAD(P)-dependent oxidoreductase [Novosphingobium sp.]
MTETALKDAVALVTGASKGIGAATAVALARAGAHVVLTARDTRGLEAVEEQIHAAGGTATIAPVDLAQPDGIARLATAVSQRWGRLDVLMINAALLPQLSSVADIEQKAFNQALTVNVLATQALIANFDPLMRKSDDPRIVGLTSSVGKKGRPFWGAYGASKAAFEVLLDCHAEEVRNISRVRVAIVDPGRTRTAMRARAFPGEDPASVKPPEVVADRIVALLGEPFETRHRETINQTA